MAINHYIFFTQESYAESPNDSWILGYEHGNTPEAARKEQAVLTIGRLIGYIRF
jgi:hypothetical protein